MQRSLGFGKWSTTWGQAGIRDRQLFFFSLLIYFIFLVFYFTWQSPACDESSYFDYLVRWAKGNPERLHLLDDSKTPMIFPALAILLFKPFFPLLNENNGTGLLQWGRMGMLVYVAGLSWFLFCWLYRLLGPKKWYWPWFLFLLDPLVISNSLLLGSDIASTTCWLAGAYSAWRLGISGKSRYATLLGITIGIGIAVKPSMIFILPMAVCVYGATHLWQNTAKRFSILNFIAGLMLITIISLVVMNAAYQFKGIGTSLNKMEVRSEMLQRFRHQHSFISSLPLPISSHITSGYDLLLRNAETGGGYGEQHSYRGVFLNGQYKAIGGFPTYYVVHFFYKTTPLLLFCLILSLAILIKKRSKKSLFYYAPVSIPPLLFLIVLSFTNPFQIGIRHALPIWPFLYILAAPGIIGLTEMRRPLWLIIVLGHIIGLGQAWPNLTAYTPFWMQPKHLLWQRMNDSSLQYCNDLHLYRKFLENHPAYQAPGEVPRPGLFAVRIEECNPWPGGNQISPCWLTRYFLPKGHYKTTILLYHISAEQVAVLPPIP
jgi:hypothetical protein